MEFNILMRPFEMALYYFGDAIPQKVSIVLRRVVSLSYSCDIFAEFYFVGFNKLGAVYRVVFLTFF